MSAASKIILAIVIIAVLVAGVWFLAMRSPKPTKAPKSQKTTSSSASPAQNAPTTGQTMTIPLSAQNNSGETGTATLTDLGNGKTMVEVKLTGFPQGATQPEHIHTGSCANLGAVKYPLTPITNGTAQTTVDISIADLLKQLPLAINAHKSASEINVYTACGDLSASGTPAVNTSPAPTKAQPTPSPTPAPVYKAPASSGGASTNYGY